MTNPVVAIIAQGSMGAATARRLTGHGVKVITSLDGRSAASAQRAADAGMTAASESEIAAADIILSIVPPAEVEALARRLAPSLAASAHKPVYVDCNAVNPETVRRVAAIIEPTGAPFVDGGIIGGPPRQGYDGPSFFLSGDAAERLAVLLQYGLKVHVMKGKVGDASALKMSYAGLTKGLIALGASLALAADRAGVADALHTELAASQAPMLAQLTRGVPDMFPKAYRWVAELEEIAQFVGPAPEGRIFEAIAQLYERLAADMDGDKREIGALAKFYGAKSS